jgi:acyl-CoA synthetase (AMP-forming)/AMP-acid ligase II/acyl carrier protein
MGAREGIGVTLALSIAERLADQASRTPEAIAILALNQAPLVYKQLYAHIQEAVLTLHSLGIGRNDPVGIILPNGREMAVAFLGVASGATAAPVNPAYRAAELEAYLIEIQAKAVIVQAGVDSPARAVARARGIPMVELYSRPSAGASLFTLTGERRVSLGHPEFARPGDVALLLPTSGTTSRPKLVPLTHASLFESARNIQTSLALTHSDRCLNVMPLFHIHGLVGALLSSLVAGASVVCTPGFQLPQFFAWLEEFRPTWYTAVPTMHRAVLSSARARDPNLPRTHSLRFIRSSSAPLPPNVMRELEQAFEVPVLEAYGMTEASHQICSNPLPPRERKEGSVGLAAGTEISITDGHGNLLTPGEVGKIVIRGANVMLGYAANPGANEDCFSHGWFRTGDQGYLDNDGYLFIVGRLGEIINRGGEKVSPFEVDQVLLDHPAIAEAVTFAVAHATLGEDIAAAVVLKAESHATEQELQAFVAARLVECKVPRRVIIVDHIPRGATGKTQRVGLAEVFAETLRADLAAPTNAFEAAVASIYSEVLSIPTVGRHDNFFLLGGDSLRGTQVLSRVRSLFQVNFPIATIFRKSTVADLADEIAAITAERECGEI